MSGPRCHFRIVVLSDRDDGGTPFYCDRKLDHPGRHRSTWVDTEGDAMDIYWSGEGHG